jgi:hypothetical protein
VPGLLAARKGRAHSGVVSRTGEPALAGFEGPLLAQKANALRGGRPVELAPDGEKARRHRIEGRARAVHPVGTGGSGGGERRQGEERASERTYDRPPGHREAMASCHHYIRRLWTRVA